MTMRSWSVRVNVLAASTAAGGVCDDRVRVPSYL